MIEELEFREWPKTARLNRDMIVTEKVDGTNAAVRVIPAAGLLGLPEVIHPGAQYEQHIAVEDANGRLMLVGAQSRKKLITPGKQTDNYGFAQFVFDNAQAFADTLGEGIHFGEWYGPGVQKNPWPQGFEGKRFMLFNVTRWGAPETRELLKGRFNGQVEVATVLYEGPFDVDFVNDIVYGLKTHGSKHVPGFTKPEGVIVFNTAAGINFKVTCERDEAPKGLANG